MSTQPVVAIVDALGNATASTADVSVTIESTAVGLLEGTTTVAAVDGVASFTDLRLVGMAGAFVLRFSSPDLAGVDAAAITLASGAASLNSYVIAEPQSLVADGVGTSTIRVVLVDGDGLLLTAGGDIVEVEVDLGSVGPVTDHGDGTYTAVYTAGTIAGPVDVTTSVTTPLGGFELMPPGDPVVTLFPGAATVGASTVDADPTELVQNGSSSSLLTVRLRDAYGNDLDTGVTLVLVHPCPAGFIWIGSVCTPEP